MIAFSFGSINIYWYGIFYLVGFLLGYFFLRLIGKSLIFQNYKNLQNLLYKNTDDVIISIIIGVLLGGRLGEVFIYQWDYFSTHLLEIFFVWNGGMSFIGGILGVILALFVLKRLKNLNNIEFWLLIDCIVFVVPLAIIFGRFGNYLNQELYGLIVPQTYWGFSDSIIRLFTNLNIFHIYKSIDLNLRINTNFLSMFFEGFIIFVIMIIVMKNRIKNKIIKPGFIVGLFLTFYSLFRFFLEYLRFDSQSQYLSIFTISQWIFLFLFLLGLYFVFNKKIKKLKV